MNAIKNPAEFWYGRINKHPEDATREEVWKLMESYHQAKSKEEAEEREKEAVKYFTNMADTLENEKSIKWETFGVILGKVIRIASGKEES